MTFGDFAIAVVGTTLTAGATIVLFTALVNHRNKSKSFSDITGRLLMLKHKSSGNYLFAGDGGGLSTNSRATADDVNSLTFILKSEGKGKASILSLSNQKFVGMNDPPSSLVASSQREVFLLSGSDEQGLLLSRVENPEQCLGADGDTGAVGYYTEKQYWVPILVD